MQVLILGGFLGSGKTSLLLQLARYMVDASARDSGYQVVILENEIGKEGIDDKLLRGNGLNVENLFEGCACCTMAGELVNAADQIRQQYHPDWLIVETTGLAYPGLIQDNLKNGLHVESRICTVVDASRWARLFQPMYPLLTGQIERADVVLLNKKDLVTEETLSAIETDIQAINDKAARLYTSALETIEADFWKQVLGE